MSRWIIAALATILLVALLAVAHPAGFKPEGQLGPVLGKPLSGIEERQSEQIMDDGARDDHPSSGLFYRDEKGRMRVESQTKVVIYDPTVGLIYVADLRTKTYQKTPIQPTTQVSIAVVEDGIWVVADRSQAPAAQPRTAPAPATLTPAPRIVREDLPPAVIAGVQVHGSRITSVIPTGAFGNDHELKAVNERWYSDDIKALIKSSNSDPRFGSLKYALTNISQAPPDPSLFQLPSGFTLLTDKNEKK